MKRNSFHPVGCVLFVALLCGCQRELSFENGQFSSGALQKDLNANCLPINISGTYITGRNFNDSNFIEVQVHVSKPGVFVIRTDSINGYFFKASGSFPNTGDFTVKLPGSGKPLTRGTNNFTVVYDSSSCQASITVRDTGNKAAFDLVGSPNSCMVDSLAGAFVKGIILDTSSKIFISVNVTTPGNYSVSTNQANGYGFSGAGAFASTGIQTIILTASGTPLNAGTDIFTVTANASKCSFSVLVHTPIVATNPDHFPLTYNSYWVYDDLFHVGDSIKHTVTDTLTINNHLYSIMKEEVRFVGPFQYYYRKAGFDYYEYCIADKFTGSFAFATPQYVDLKFMQENLSTGASWESQEYAGIASFGQNLHLKYLFKCTNDNAAVVVNGKAFTNVYIIELRPQIKSDFADYGYTGEYYVFYYAKGVGLVYEKETKTGSGTFTFIEWALRNWQVN
jgi:hypothetical protein